MRDGADLTDRAGRGLDRVGPQRLDRIDDGQIGAFGIQRGQDVAQRGFGAQPHRRIARPSRCARMRTWALASSPEI
jgi:hypothetical protein